MTVNEKTLVKTTLGIQVAVLLSVASGAYYLGQISTKVDALWAAHSIKIACQSSNVATIKGNP